MPKKLLIWAVGLIILATAIGGCGSSGGNNSSAGAAKTETVTETVTLTETVATEAEPVVCDDGSLAAAEADCPIPASDEADACQHMERAMRLSVNSSRWNQVVLDAEDAAVSDTLYNLLDEAYWADHGNSRLLANAHKRFC